MDEEEITDDDTPQTKCCACDHQIELGADVYTIREGVLGHRGLVPLKPEMFFCSLNCLEEYVYAPERPKLPRRVP